MRDLWILSTFPCSTIVWHTQNIQPYARLGVGAFGFELPVA